MICSRPMNTLSTKYSKSWSRVSGVSMVASAPGVGVTASAIVVEKQTTMLAFNEVMRDLARRGSLGGNVVVSAMNSLFSAMGVRLASRKLAQIVPVAGVVVSAGLNAALMRTIGETADHLYRERFLAERYGRVETSDGASTDLARSADSQELSADIARYVEIAEAESRP